MKQTKKQEGSIFDDYKERQAILQAASFKQRVRSHIHHAPPHEILPTVHARTEHVNEGIESVTKRKRRY